MIPLSVPNISGNEWKYIKECLDTNWVSSVGSFVDDFERIVAEYTGSTYAISTVNGTSALHISLLLAEVGQGDLVLAPNITFIASANSIKYTGASPIFIDINPETWQMDLDLLETFLENETTLLGNKCVHTATGKTVKAIMPVHVLGNACDLNHLLVIANKHSLTVVEDASESLGTKFQGKHTGTFGKLGCISFNGNKIITTGGGGMILTNDEKLAKRAKHLTTQAKSHPFEYVHDEVGYNYRMVNILAAMGVAQMERLSDFVLKKKHIASLYNSLLQNIPSIQFQKIQSAVDCNNWLFTILVERQNDLMQYLIKHSIQVRPLWVPMNQLKMFEEDLFIEKNNISDNIYKRSISLPSSTAITDEEIKHVCDLIKDFF